MNVSHYALAYGQYAAEIMADSESVRVACESITQTDKYLDSGVPGVGVFESRESP